MLPHVVATRYVTPLREGGSLPGLMEADDLGTYVVKFHGAGQGRKALVAEVVSARLARAIGLRVPDLVTVEVDPILAAANPTRRCRICSGRAAGATSASTSCPGPSTSTPAAFDSRSRRSAGRVLWFDALVGNVDRSWRNPNMLFWHGRLYLIDHGATLTFHHNWPAADGAPARPYDAADHVADRAARRSTGRRGAGPPSRPSCSRARSPRPRRLARRRARVRRPRARCVTAYVRSLRRPAAPPRAVAGRTAPRVAVTAPGADQRADARPGD